MASVSHAEEKTIVIPIRRLAVRLQNLNSLCGAHEVRFDKMPLREA
jgi:hypothetical protein